MENKPPRRRWMRFSLRSLLVFVTLLAIYLGWAMNWIRQRREFLTKPPKYLGTVETEEDGLIFGAEPMQAPLCLRILGESGVSHILLQPYRNKYGVKVEVPPGEVERLIDLFPETNIQVFVLFDQGAQDLTWNFDLVVAEQWLSQQRARAAGEKRDP